MFLTSWFRKETCLLLLSKAAFFFWVYAVNLCKNSISPKSLGHAAIKLKIIFYTMVLSFKKHEKTMNLPYIMGRLLRNGINERDQGLSSCSYKTYQPLKYPKCQKWGKVDSFTSRDIVTFLTGWFPLPSWNPGRRCLELQPFKTKACFHYLTQGPWNTVLRDIYLWVLIYDCCFDGNLSGGLLSLYFLYIDLLVGRRCSYSDIFFHLSFTNIVHTISSD